MDTHSTLSPADLDTLRHAHANLEGTSFAMKMVSKAGVPLESLMRLLPAQAQVAIGKNVDKALQGCLRLALSTPMKGEATPSSKRMHTLTTALTGAAGGFFGLPGLAVELPLTTTVMLHSIAEIARANGEDLSKPESALSCVEVLALGPQGGRHEVLESAYYASRAAMAQVTRDAAAYIAEKGMVKEGAPALLAFLSRVAARFGLEVSEKAAVQLVPVAGAAGGAAINIMFMNHFQQLAEGHFAIRRLERTYGAELVKSTYEQLG